MSDVAYPAEHVTEADLGELVRRESRAAGFDVVRIARLVTKKRCGSNLLLGASWMDP